MRHRRLSRTVTVGHPPARVLHRAAKVLRRRGLAKGACYDPTTGAVDTVGALQMACGVKVTALTDDMFDAVAVVPRAHLHGFTQAWLALDATVDGLEEWQDMPSTKVDDVLRLLESVAELFERRTIDV